MKKFYITNSIVYVNAPGHIGYALELIQTDVIARTKRQQGNDVFFLTGTDEHGTKIVQAAADAETSLKDFTDNISSKFFELAKILNISNDDFIRTTDSKRHWPSVREVWNKLQENGDLEKRMYEGLYCSGCEAFITEKELVKGQCPIHKQELEKVKEENWFFKLSKYGSQLKAKIESDELRIVPEGRKKEILGFIKQGLEDVSFSRPKEKLQWGIPVPGDDSQVIYVWADALVNYISALGYPEGEKFKKYWPADVHVVGKDILRFHATIWPAMLLSIGIELPKTIFAHGFITVEGKKMSKSLGNVIDPVEIVEKYGVDAVRYFFLREIPAAEDGDFSYGKFEERHNADLAGGLGNLVSRVVTIAKKAGVKTPSDISDKDLEKEITEVQKDVASALGEFRFHEALEAVWRLVHSSDRYIEQERPWEEGEKQKEVIGDLLFTIEAIGDILQPFLPETADRIQQTLKKGAIESLFPRIS